MYKRKKKKQYGDWQNDLLYFWNKMCYISYHIQSNKAVQWYLSTLIRRSIYITGCLYPLAWELPLLFSKLGRCFESFCSCSKGMGCWGGEKQGISHKSGHEDSPQHAACTSQWEPLSFFQTEPGSCWSSQFIQPVCLPVWRTAACFWALCPWHQA